MKYALVALLALGLAACSGNQQSSSTTTAPESSPSAMAAATEAAPNAMASSMAMAQTLTIQIKPQSGSGESGTAMLTAVGNSTRVVIAIKGESATGIQPAHIHMGSCAKLNPAPKYPLTNVVGGKSTTLVNAPFATITAGGMAINVHDSAANLKKYVACGDIAAKHTTM